VIFLPIHTVTPGQSLWKISLLYKVPYQTIAKANGLVAPYNLVIGESLYIPRVAQRHIVRQGESLWSISREYKVSIDALMDVNQIPASQAVYPGQVLIIPAEAHILGTIESNAYIEPSGAPQKETTEVTDVNNYLTYLSLFSYRVQEDGSLISPPNDQTIINAARAGRAAPLMSVTNFRSGTFDTKLASAILTDPAVQDVLINNILQTLGNKKFYGVNVDFERVSPSDRDLYTAFIRKLRDKVKPAGYVLSTALAPKLSATQIGAWYEAHDYGAHGALADFVILMTYEWGWSGGPPLPVAPINMVKKVLDYAVTVIPRNKIMMGTPLYGYDWTLPYTPGGRFARRVSPVQAVQLAKQYNTQIQYDQTAQSPYFRYTTANGQQHIVWFEDPRSILAKFRVIKQYGLRGISYWVLGSDFPQNWLMLADYFNIKKVI
jgi:spore germination protein